MREKMTKKSLLGKSAVYVAMTDIRMDIMVTSAAYSSPHDNLEINTNIMFMQTQKHLQLHRLTSCLFYQKAES